LRKLKRHCLPMPDAPRTQLVGVPFAATDTDDTGADSTEAASDVPSKKPFRADNPNGRAKTGTTSAGLQRPLRIRRHCSSRTKSADPRSPSLATLGSVPGAADGIHHQKR